MFVIYRNVYMILLEEMIKIKITNKIDKKNNLTHMETSFG
jgi:hypothetical protein